DAEKAVAQGRGILAKNLNCKPKELIFTSGGTESNNLAIKGIAEFYQNRGKHIITTKIEHPSVLEVCQELEQEGFAITYLEVDHLGNISLEELQEAITPETILVTIMMVNNELGAVQPIKDLAAIIKKQGKAPFFHVDGVQAMGMLPIDLQELSIDLFSFSGHKFHGPKGVGGLFIKEGVQLVPLLDGGGQEKGIRSGTENVPGIVGMAKALAIAGEAREDKAAKIRALQQLLWNGISTEVADCKLNSDLVIGAPHIISISFPGIKGEVLLHYLESEGIYVSTGSACGSRSRNISHVLQAIGLNDKEADGTIRFSLSVETEEADILYTVDKITAGIKELRLLMGR
ncbi:MAG: cysteine desulfurase family protein, partial [Bacillota bacterium]|nr:cysteine desulfurase family protein [Bacillota bacterium]